MPELNVPRASLIAATVLAQVGPVTAWRAAEWARKIAEPMIAAELRSFADNKLYVDNDLHSAACDRADEIDDGTP